MKLNDLRIYCQNEEDQLNVVSFLEENFPDTKISTWDPDPVDTGTWGMFVDEFEPDHTRLIFCDGAFAGCFALLPRKDHLYLGHFYISTKFQGQGIGKAVMADLLGAADALKKPIRLIVLNESPAVEFYTAFGFEITQRDDIDIVMQRDI